MSELTAFLMVGNSKQDLLELQRANVVLQTLDHFWVGDSPLRVLVGHHDSLVNDIAQLTEESFSNLDVSALSDTQMVGEAAMRIISKTGWYRQQLIRILYTQQVSSGPVLLLDTDTFAASYFSSETFSDNGRILSAWEARSNKGWWELSEKLFDTQGRKNYFGMLNTPNVVSGELFAKINDVVATEYGDVLSFLNGVLTLNRLTGENPFTEYTYYNLIAEKSGLLYEQHVEPDEQRLQYTDKNVWSESDLLGLKTKPEAAATPFRIVHGGLGYVAKDLAILTELN